MCSSGLILRSTATLPVTSASSSSRSRTVPPSSCSAFAVFALGFVARPVGGLVLGLVGDRIGRRALLTLSIALMGGATLLLGLLPTYEQIGVAAPLLLVTMRLIQGFSLGGEFTGSMVYTTEKASPLTRGIISSSTAAGTTLGFILGSTSAWLVNRWMSVDEVSVWGWRIPFVGSILFCVVGYFLRRGITETEEGLKAAAIRPPFLPSLLSDWLPIVQTFGIVAMTNAAYYLTFTYAVEQRKSLLGEGGESFPAGEHHESVRGAVLEAAGRLAFRSCGAPQAHDDPDGRHHGLYLSGAATGCCSAPPLNSPTGRYCSPCRSAWRSDCRARWWWRSFP